MSLIFWSTDPVGNYHSSACSGGFETTLRPVKKRDGKLINCTLEMYYSNLLICVDKASTCFRSYANESVPVETVFNNIYLFDLGYLLLLVSFANRVLEMTLFPRKTSRDR